MLRGLGDCMPLDQNIFTAKFILWIAALRRIAMRLHAIMKIEYLSGVTKRRINLFLSPDIECAFGGPAVAGIADPGYNWAIGIFCGEKSAFLGGHIAGNVVEDIARDRLILSVLCDLKSVEIGGGELCLIVEHFFEMRHVPVTINRVTMKTAADMVVHTAGRHFAQGKEVHLQCVFAGVAFRISRVKSGKKIERHWARKFRRIAETSLLGIVTARNLLIRGV